ncbi:MAG: DUF368 domain-containing protein [Bacteroidales bacterium]|jgi:putative membrane protein|nr:DUF368 domain-containing protein [Bacteroidales bacterium]
MKRSFLDYALITLKGIAMGGADLIPGISGGTVAFITGIYEEFVESIKSFIPAIQQLFGKKPFKQRFTDFWRTVNGSFFLALLPGIFLAMVLLAKFVKLMLSDYKILTFAFFFGLILASIVLLYKKIPKWTWSCIGFALIGVVLGFLLPLPEAMGNGSNMEVSLGYLFICSCIAICAFILPGISGSFVMMLMGAYHTYLTAIEKLNLLHLGVMASGFIIGLVAFSNVLSWLLKKYYNWTVALLTGFIVGSLQVIWPWKASTGFYMTAEGVPYPSPVKNVLPNVFEYNAESSAMITQAIIACVVGFVVVLSIEFIANQISKRKS